MSERERVIAWKRSGRSLRWRLLRIVVAICSLRWMTLVQVQDIMVGLQGLTHAKTLQLLSELERAGYMKQERGDDGFWMWGSTPKGVTSWLPKGDPAAIPAHIVEEVLTLTPANESEKDREVLGGPSF